MYGIVYKYSQHSCLSQYFMSIQLFTASLVNRCCIWQTLDGQSQSTFSDNLCRFEFNYIIDWHSFCIESM